MDDSESLHLSISCITLVPPWMLLLLLRCSHHYSYMIIDDRKVPHGADIFHISYSMWCSLGPNGLKTQNIDGLNKSLCN